MSEIRAGETYLLVDIGRVLTHAAYIAPVEGTARLVALAQTSTTHTTTEAGLLEGVRLAAANLEAIVGRRLMDAAGDLKRPCDADGHGVDGAVLTTSLAPTLRVALVGLTRDFSLESAIRAATLPYVSLVRTISLEDSTRRWETKDLQALVEEPPDVTLLVGGVDGGPIAPIRDLGEALSAAYSVLPANARPVIIYAGNAQAVRPLIASFTGVATLRIVPNVRPTPHTENLEELRNELARLFQSRELARSEQLRAVSQWAGINVTYDLDAAARTLRFAARRHGLFRGILGVDVGGSGTRVILVRPEGAALTWATPYGTGTGVSALRRLSDPMTVLRWMCHPLSWAEVWDRLSNVEVRPAGVPQSPEDWDLQQATVREALHASWLEAQAAWARHAGDDSVAAGVDMVVAQGTALSHARTPGQAALTLIDALQPTGLLRLSLDWANLLPGLAGLAQLNPRAGVEVFDNDALLELGTLVAPAGLARPGPAAVRASLTVHGEKRSEVAVPAGSIRCLPLGVNELGRLELSLAPGLNLDDGKRGRSHVFQVRGGELGVVIDARGRPLMLPDEEAKRREAVAGWQREIDEHES